MTPAVQPRNVVPAIAWEELRFPGERELVREARQRPTLHAELQRWCDLHHVGQVGRRVPAAFPQGGVRATAGICPALFRIGNMVRDTLRLESELELQVIAANEWFIELTPASVALPQEIEGQHTPRRAKVTLVLSSLVVERLWVRETLFCVGRKLGRVLFSQWPLLADPTTGIERPNQDTLLLRGLWKFQELTCDRVGLLCCQDLAAAARGIIKATSGLPSELLHLDIEALMRGRVREEEAMVGDNSHDFSVLRVMALRQFVQSSKFAGALGLEGFPPPAALVLPPARTSTITVVESSPRPVPAKSATPELATPRADENERSPGGREEWGTFELLPEDNDPESAPDDQNPALAELPPFARGIALLDAERAAHWFTLYGAFWVASAKEEVSQRELETLSALLQPQVLAELEKLYDVEEETTFLTCCRLLAPKVRELESDVRLGILNDLLAVALAEGMLDPWEDERLGDLAELLGLTADEMALAAAEYADPEYANYQFQPGQEVEVHMDGAWIAGRVSRVETSGDLRVHFAAENETLRLSPTADLIRPVFRSSA